MKITALYFYPVKSLRGIRVDTLPLDAAGPRHDREWMVVDTDGKFVTQREEPKMQLVRTAVDEEALTLTAPGGLTPLRVPLTSSGGAARAVEVWGSRAEGIDEGSAAAKYLSSFLGRPVSLVRLGMKGRQEEADGKRYQVRFADACPLLLCSEDSLAELNARAGSLLAMERFRPNVVVEGAAPFAEDGWRGFTANNLYFERIRACTRCTVTTVDPLTAARGPEPLKTLATFRRGPGGRKVEFGQYFYVPGEGELSVGANVRSDE